MFNFKNAFSLLQKIGKCMMLPVSVLPVAGPCCAPPASKR